MKTKTTKSLRKYFRLQKSKIRKTIHNQKEQKELIEKLYSDKNVKRKN